jgi:hypothetical protein
LFPAPAVHEETKGMMTRNRPLEDWGKLIGDVPSATAILDRFLHHAEIIAINGKSYRLRNQKTPAGEDTKNSKPDNLPTGSAARRKSKSEAEKPATEVAAVCES